MKITPVVLSKTVWINLIVTALGILALLTKLIPPDYEPWIVFATGVLNLVLRIWFTNSAVSFRVWPSFKRQ